ncbi:MAG: hypothetical protein CUN55_12815 [Phototrophicales bacterium]|nr:MAG: hypothetical protein CUN55_12815 [Phototrophicales bacterium]
MRIGVDFDNTLVDYTGVFYQVAQTLGLTQGLHDTDKQSVKQHIVMHFGESQWTRLQGLVYGPYIQSARAYAGAWQCISSFLDKGHEWFIVSHKTRYPVIGDKVDLHRAATKWLRSNIASCAQSGSIQFSDIFFEQSFEDKLARIESLHLDWFIDDLPSVVTALDKKGMQSILFDPHQHHEARGFRRCSNWQEVEACLNESKV